MKKSGKVHVRKRSLDKGHAHTHGDIHTRTLCLREAKQRAGGRERAIEEEEKKGDKARRRRTRKRCVCAFCCSSSFPSSFDFK